MAFSFSATPKTATGFTLPTTATPATTASGFSFGATAGAGEPQKPAGGSLFGSVPSTTTLGSSSHTFGAQAGLGAAKTTTASTFAAPAVTTTTSTPGGFGFGARPITSAPAMQFAFSTPIAAATTAASAPQRSTTALSFTPVTKPTLSTAPSSSTQAAGSPAAKLTFKLPTTTSAPTSTAVPSLPLGSISTSVATTSSALPAATTTSSIVPTTGSLTFNQLEDMINKWTIDLEEQSKVFINQSKQLNAWDMLLISNGEKVLNLSNGIERVKQQQQQLDQELDFVLAQQKELEELIVPLEKELNDIPITDQERNYTYQLAEKLDSQLKQMSEDLKEIIENLNESNKSDELADPVIQISRIMNAHMNSLQWIDRNVADISANLEQISKLQDLNRRNNLF